MAGALAEYRAVIQSQPECEDSWLGDSLARARAGDDEARRRILGSFLRLALERAEARVPASGRLELFDLIQEANAGLNHGLATFDGQTVGELESWLRDSVERAITNTIHESESPA